jgi:hypothetical protein
MHSIISHKRLPCQIRSSISRVSLPVQLLFIRYTWSQTDETLFFLDADSPAIINTAHPERFPGLTTFIDSISPHLHALLQQRLRPTSKILIFDALRGPQSFAFGHFFIDLLPVVYYESLRAHGLEHHKLLVYRHEQWQQDLLQLFSLPSDSLIALDSLSPIVSSQNIRLYHCVARIGSYSMDKIRRLFVGYTPDMALPVRVACKSVLFLTRDSVGHRPRRWENISECIHVLRCNPSDIQLSCIDPGLVLPSQLAHHSLSYQLIITPPGSGAYIPIHVASTNSVIVMAVPYNVHSPAIWNFTLSMFRHYSRQLILVSQASARPPGSPEWDLPFTIDPSDFSRVCHLIMNQLGGRDVSAHCASLNDLSCPVPSYKSKVGSIHVLSPFYLAT